MRPKDRMMFGIGILGLLLGLLNVAHPTRYDDQYWYVLKLGWFLYAAVFFYRAYRPFKSDADQ